MPRTGTLRASHVATYQRALTAHGFRVRLARTGKEALELVKDTLPECAVIDLRLPDMSGWDPRLAHPAVAEELVRTIRRVLDLEIASPPSPAEALLDLMACAACGFCWRVEVLQPTPQSGRNRTIRMNQRVP
jgi:hypothetical protein